MSGMFQRILIANRGEIAVRVIRACRELGIVSAAVFSEADRAALHVRLADEAYPLEPAPARESYLRLEKLLDIVQRAGCDALHPGYGFLADDPVLPHACEAAGITFIGPSADALEATGSKIAARQLARRAGVPLVPGAVEALERLEDAEALAREVGYPVVLKAVAARRGAMRVVSSPAELAAAWDEASGEAERVSGDPRLYLERYLKKARHLEVQILADSHGRVVSLGERECSVMRGRQRIMEEAPSPVVSPDLRRKLSEAAVRVARTGGFVNAGTVEFLLDSQLDFHFLGASASLQAGHAVTEQVTGLDLVKLQIAIAAGHRLPFAWESITPRGHAIECRIRAEDTDRQSAPSRGTVLSCRAPHGPGVRLDDGVDAGWTVPAEYDPLIGKLIAWGNSREEAMARLRRALAEYVVCGIRTNTGLFRRILAEPDFISGEIHTRWLDQLLEARSTAQAVRGDGDSAGAADAAATAVALRYLAGNPAAKPVARKRATSRLKLAMRIAGKTRRVELETGRKGRTVRLDGRRVEADAVEVSPRTYSILLGGRSHEVRVAPSPDGGGLQVQTGNDEFVVEILKPRAKRGGRS
jgi:acetyl-CoA carboxylase, biotin carboxylase subunit